MTPGAALLVASTLLQGLAPPEAGLSLLLACGERPGVVSLAVHNPGDTDTAALLGIALANGEAYLPREFVVEIRRRGNPDVEELVYNGPRGIAGRIDHGSSPFQLAPRSRSRFVRLTGTFVPRLRRACLSALDIGHEFGERRRRPLTASPPFAAKKIIYPGRTRCPAPRGSAPTHDGRMP